ncbi:MAG TPA: ATP-binding protein [Candidatus Saccharimonadaceae bacterium]|jgi:serine/threonine-protein kinase RsbW|nr:ATP-binding protein [Candidatus Saccharimonadaceae bacterium]
MSRPSTSPEIIELRMPSRLELLGVLDRVAASLCERLEFDDDTSSQVSMSVIEAGTNAIQHGHQRDASKVVDVTFTVLPDAIDIKVRDTGKGFKPSPVNGDVTSPEHLFDARGRGIFIMRTCMDQVEFSFDASGTVCHLLKRRPTPVP